MSRRVVIWLAAAALAVAAGAQKESKREKKQREKIEDLSEKLGRRLRYPEPTPEQTYLHKQAAALLDRVKAASHDDYRFDRLARAADALLEASEEILDARRTEQEEDEDDRREAALDLQRDYFRIQQADYFAKLSGEPEAGTYIKHARALYQQARQAFDAGEYDRAETLGDAASYIVRALEYLAQAAIGVPEPPRL